MRSAGPGRGPGQRQGLGEIRADAGERVGRQRQLLGSAQAGVRRGLDQRDAGRRGGAGGRAQVVYRQRDVVGPRALLTLHERVAAREERQRRRPGGQHGGRAPGPPDGAVGPGQPEVPLPFGRCGDGIVDHERDISEPGVLHRAVQ
jgi:hypothetical protein